MTTTLKSSSVRYQLTQGGGVPGGHNLIFGAGKDKPFVPQMGECNSIPLRHSDVVVDIGAYLGTYAIRCARFPVKQVMAYEPTPSTFEILALTHLPNMQLVNAAVVGDDRPTVDLFISSGIGVTNSIAKSLRKVDRVTVPAIHYAEAVKDATIVKIDVEGAEYDYPIVQPSLRAVILDFHRGKDWIDKARKIITDLEAAGFTPVIEPVLESNRWSPAGAWIRDMETEGEYTPMMSGAQCCGCGRTIHADAKALCKDCWNTWLPKHRAGFLRALF